MSKLASWLGSVIMVSLCLPSDALSQHLLSYLGFFYLGREVSLHNCSSKAQLLLLTLDEECLLMAAPPDLELGVAPLSTPPDLGLGVAPLSCSCTITVWCSQSFTLNIFVSLIFCCCYVSLIVRF